MNGSKVGFAFSNRGHGNTALCYGDTKNSLSNRRSFLKNLNIDYRSLVCAKQVHSSNIRFVGRQDMGKGALSYETALDDTDALVTNEKNLPLAIFTADCLSIFFHAPEFGIIALAHAGWRSSLDEIAVKTCRYMRDKLNVDLRSLNVYFGPAIRSCCYEVSKKMEELFRGGLILRSNKYYLDLSLINKQQLLSIGLKEENIRDAGICTSCNNSNFFSFRREGQDCGRMMSVIMLR
jgi:YfiH family protein